MSNRHDNGVIRKADLLRTIRGILRIIRANALTIFVEIGLDARDSICSPAALERGEYVHHEHAVLQDVLALLAHVRCVVATARHLHHAAE